MLSEAIKQRFKDPDYLRLHMHAVSAIRDVGKPKWYDAHFLRRLEAAGQYLATVRPDARDDFLAEFEQLKAPQDAPIHSIYALFDPATHSKIKQIAADIPGEMLERHEVSSFGRHVVHDHPYFLELQAEVLPKVSELVGRELATGYNFLSLYGGSGKCDVHMDEPLSMYTLDYCIDQSEEWPIYFSQIVDWPKVGALSEWTPETVLANPDMEFSPRVLQPNQALVFTGSSQWHYRKAITPGAFCNLLFFHYFPVGCEELVYPSKWASYFDIPELEPLCELFSDSDVDGLV